MYLAIAFFAGLCLGLLTRIKARREASTWITRDGHGISIGDLQTTHLINTIQSIRSEVSTLREQVLQRMARYIDTAPDGAAADCKNEMERVARMTDEEFLLVHIPQWSRLLNEAAKRSGELPGAHIPISAT